MSEKQDLRVQKTYAALFQAFQELLTEKDFESITVTELCDRAMIRTATFYKHFADKYAFFAFLINEGLNRYREMLTDRSTSCEEYYLNIIRLSLRLFQENPVLIHAVRSNDMMNIIARTTGARLGHLLVEHLKHDQENGCDLAVPPELTAEILMGSIHHLCNWRLEHRNGLSDEDFICSLRPFVQRLLGR